MLIAVGVLGGSGVDGGGPVVPPSQAAASIIVANQAAARYRRGTALVTNFLPRVVVRSKGYNPSASASRSRVDASLGHPWLR